MELPNRFEAFIPPQKLVGYLLSSTHAVGKGKAKFFRHFGFNELHADWLNDELLIVAHTATPIRTTTTPFGTKYVIDGTIDTPDGIMINVRTVWIIEEGEPRPRFVTAYPNSR